MSTSTELPLAQANLQDPPAINPSHPDQKIAKGEDESKTTTTRRLTISQVEAADIRDGKDMIRKGQMKLKLAAMESDTDETFSDPERMEKLGNILVQQGEDKIKQVRAAQASRKASRETQKKRRMLKAEDTFHNALDVICKRARASFRANMPVAKKNADREATQAIAKELHARADKLLKNLAQDDSTPQEQKTKKGQKRGREESENE